MYYNNLGTNFSVSQVCDVLFRYVFTTRAEPETDSVAALFGWQAVTPFDQILTERTHKGTLPSMHSFVQVDNPRVILLTFKKAEDGEGYVLRFWNTASGREQATLAFPGLELVRVCWTSIIEENLEPLEVENVSKGVHFTLEAGELRAIRVVFHQDR